MNLIILRLASAMLSLGAGFIRTTLFALLGAAVAALAAGGGTRFSCLNSPTAKLFLTALMSLALPGRGLRARALAFLAVFVSAAAVGGAVLLLALALGGSISFGAVYAGLSLRAALIGGAVSALLPGVTRRLLARRVEAGQTVRFEAELQSGERIECAALIDSGNLLSEPLSALPIIVLNERQYAAAAGAAHIPIPARTASGECTLYALKPKRAAVNGRPVNTLIAFSKAEAALVPACLVRGEEMRSKPNEHPKGSGGEGATRRGALPKKAFLFLLMKNMSNPLPKRSGEKDDKADKNSDTEAV